MINLDDKQSKGTHWVSLFIDRNIVAFFDQFGIEYILQEVLTIKRLGFLREFFFLGEGGGFDPSGILGLNKVKDKFNTDNIFRM